MLCLFGFEMTVLVACPTAKVKDYALSAYMNAYNNFSYKKKRLLMVDTSPAELEYYKTLKEAGCETVISYECNEISLTYLITCVWEDIIIPYAWEIGAEWILSLESDVICPPGTIEMLVESAEWYNASIVSHSYGARGYQERKLVDGIGCVLFKRKLFEPGDSFYDYFEKFVRMIPYSNGIRGVELVNILGIVHLEDDV